MAQFSTHLPVLLLLLTVLNPIVCPSSKLITDIRDRAPYIETRELGPQYLIGPAATRSRKAQISDTPPSSHLQNFGQNDQVDIEEKIERVFATKFGPGLHLFKNTAPKDNSDFTLYDNEYMQGDQPQPPLTSSESSLSSSTEAGFFKVQRSPSGKLDVVYQKDFESHQENDSTSSHNKVNDALTADSLSQSRVKQGSGDVTPPKKQSPIYFPTEEPVGQHPEVKYTVNSDDCVEKDKPFCTSLRNYPERSHLEQVIKKKFSNLDIFFGEDLVVPQNISQRMNGEPNEEYLCQTRTRIIYPEAGLNKDYNWLIIVNIPNYKQGIRIEECVNEGSTCGEMNGLMLPNRVTATCKQNYIYRSLVAYANETVIRDQFKMPSCCKCVIKRH